MDKQAFVDWIKEQRYVGKGFREDERELVERLDRTLDRFCAYLNQAHGITRIKDTTLDALRQFEFDLPANDDQHLRLAFSYLGRSDLTEYLGMVSADKYFRNKKLTGEFFILHTPGQSARGCHRILGRRGREARGGTRAETL